MGSLKMDGTVTAGPEAFMGFFGCSGVFQSGQRQGCLCDSRAGQRLNAVSPQIQG